MQGALMHQYIGKTKLFTRNRQTAPFRRGIGERLVLAQGALMDALHQYI
jgi:hypothetical protein